jgi:hypothetical protein
LRSLIRMMMMIIVTVMAYACMLADDEMLMDRPPPARMTRGPVGRRKKARIVTTLLTILPVAVDCRTTAYLASRVS